MLKHEFCNNIPEKLSPGIIYISIEFTTAIHLCPCGCGEEVVTPFSPTDWELIFNGVSVSLYPSIGNWSQNCKSHYWIKRNKIHWAREFSKNWIKSIQMKERKEKEDYYNKNKD
jgi:hypothetical protein